MENLWKKPDVSNPSARWQPLSSNLVWLPILAKLGASASPGAEGQTEPQLTNHAIWQKVRESRGASGRQEGSPTGSAGKQRGSGRGPGDASVKAGGGLAWHRCGKHLVGAGSVLRVMISRRPAPGSQKLSSSQGRDRLSEKITGTLQDNIH